MADQVDVVLRKSASYQVGEPSVIFAKDVPKTLHTDGVSTASDKADYLLQQRTPKGEPYFEIAPSRNRSARSVFGGVDIGKKKSSKKIRGIEVKNGKVKVSKGGKSKICSSNGCKNPAMDGTKFCPIHTGIH